MIHWLPNCHKTPHGLRFIIAFNNCSTKPLSAVISKVFKILFKHVKNFHKKSTFYSSYKILGCGEFFSNYYFTEKSLNEVITF